MEKKRVSMLKTVVSVLIAIVFVAVCIVALRPQLPREIKEFLFSDSTDSSQETNKAIDDWYLETSPDKWFSIGEDVDWNSQLLFCVEAVTVSETPPTDIAREDVVRRFEELSTDAPLSEQLSSVAQKNDSLFVDLTFRATCTDIIPLSVYDIPALEEEYLLLAFGNMALSVYERDTGALYEASLAAYEDGLFATQDLSGNQPEHDGMKGAYELRKGESCKGRLIYMISRDHWEQNAVLLTPKYGHLDTETLLTAGYSQPHIWLNR
ncbi:MAG: hypothetical protein IJB27_04695 [Clostridia bacterium]|nr:hypothetical protein [Clostridia bacterium]